MHTAATLYKVALNESWPMPAPEDNSGHNR